MQGKLKREIRPLFIALGPKMTNPEEEEKKKRLSKAVKSIHSSLMKQHGMTNLLKV